MSDCNKETMDEEINNYACAVNEHKDGTLIFEKCIIRYVYSCAGVHIPNLIGVRNLTYRSMIPSLFWDLTQRRLLMAPIYRRFGTTHVPSRRVKQSKKTFEDGTNRLFRNVGKYT